MRFKRAPLRGPAGAEVGEVVLMWVMSHWGKCRLCYEQRAFRLTVIPRFTECHVQLKIKLMPSTSNLPSLLSEGHHWWRLGVVSLLFFRSSLGFV